MQRNPQRRRLMSALTSLSVAMMILGCGGGDGHTGPPRMHVWGQVTFDGKAVDDGTIEFTPNVGTNVEALRAQIKAGKYDVPAGVGPPTGTYKVTITGDRKVPGKVLNNPFSANAETIPAGATEDAIATVPSGSGPSPHGFPIYNRQEHLTNGPQTGTGPSPATGGGMLTFIHS